MVAEAYDAEIAKSTRRRGSRLPGHGIAPYLYMAPALVLFGAFLIYPVIQSFFYSLLDWDGLQPGVYVGLDNYAQLFRDPNFWNSLKITLIWVAMSGGILPLTALVLALLVDFGTTSRTLGGIARTVLFIPMTISLVAVGLLFTLFYNPLLGVINNVFLQFGMMTAIDLLGNSSTTLMAIFFVAVWQWSGFGMVIFAAALQGIPSELYDAAKIDGATKWQIIRHVVLPLLVPTYVVILTLNVIGGFKAFDLIYVMTAGGPAQASETTSIFLYKNAFVLHKFGYGSAVSVVLFIIIGIATVVLTRRRFAA
ncbi:carbohydrate ABC transporter permease [Bauldia litoralis]|uniref:Raffinose/stachyose/melibiose transport system permease protein n=2 Tax=Bauldia litoralis TaxID=665467 RepID=A0A1G6BV00_9HYPH|nr:sugar ABC transporter permease [Bauldia litoralis]SDB24407.1 raffinose/stachyose/melibiose transport system permease protein [Bauldia litoralis]